MAEREANKKIVMSASWWTKFKQKHPQITVKEGSRLEAGKGASD